ncbi:hypothetical protein F1188_16655 [Roseospira marina]|uniref:Uncharacterized protein n=1 Tax=Roseospira marina TaxID=140057 RepID=A0A5M6I827_9PROT|nr:hypothetical protein [Roseospira marina]KAA5604323.1 hypothetical protein F1188_16655 [Roseospira marina]MBB4315653.1 hypothetical protein [Roseospira marina]MBB5088711.1 hypothetical protein [Roseospira marina]
MAATRHTPTRGDWLAKILAGTLLGFTFAIGCSGVFVHLVLRLDLATKAQLAMWMVVPIWLGVLSACFAVRDAHAVWLRLGLANLAVFALLIVANQL